MELILALFVCLAGAYIAAEICQRIGIPSVIGQMGVGFILGISVIKDNVFSVSVAHGVSMLAEIGLILLLFFVGLQVDFKHFKRTSKTAILVATFGFIGPFCLGGGISYYLGFSLITSLVIAISLSLTAGAVTIQILEQLKFVKTRIGTILLQASIIDNFLGILGIAVLLTIIEAGHGSMSNIWIEVTKLAGQITIFSFIILTGRFIVLPVLWHHIENEHSEINEFTTAILLALLIAGITDWFNLSSVIGAVCAGVLFRGVVEQQGKRGIEEEKKITKVIEVLTFGFIAPFFFIWVGFQTDFSALLINPILGVGITLLAFGGKWLGVLIGNSLAKGKLEESVILSWGMNSRGAVELILAEVARENNLISHDVFSALVFMAFITTILSPIMFKYTISKYYKKDGKRRK